MTHVDELVKERLIQETYDNRRSQLENLAAIARGSVVDSDITEYESVESEVPIASDRNRWWLGDGEDPT